jgi:hypothetical protein
MHRACSAGVRVAADEFVAGDAATTVWSGQLIAFRTSGWRRTST